MPECVPEYKKTVFYESWSCNQRKSFHSPLGDLKEQFKYFQASMHTIILDKWVGEVPSVLDDTEIASVFNMMSLMLF